MNKMTNNVFIIAEAGVNHNGDLNLARKLIDVAAQAGADAVKFQTFKAENVISQFAPKADYQKTTTDAEESQLDMAKKLELNKDDFQMLHDYAQEKGIMFLSTPFDLSSIDVLNDMGLKIIKIPSGEITNLPYLRKIGALKKKVIMSTGMANLEEIKKALNVLRESGTEQDQISVLHCNTEYPTPYGDVNLLAMLQMKGELKVDVGYSDHTCGIEVSVAAVALGARIIEKHFTLDQSMDGPDHKASLSIEQLNELVRSIRNVEQALGHGRKEVSQSEQKNIPIARKSLVAAMNIKKGDIYSEDNLTVKRPGTGVSPMQWDDVMGQKALRDFQQDELIEI